MRHGRHCTSVTSDGACTQLGVIFVLDDFDMGYSLLTYL